MDTPIPFRPRRAVYVASALPNLAAARALAERLRAVGVLVTSTWHDVGATVEAERELDTAQQATIALGCLAEVDAADTFVWLHDNRGDRCGAATEYGYAIAREKDLYRVAVGDAPSVFGALAPVADVAGLVGALS